MPRSAPWSRCPASGPLAAQEALTARFGVAWEARDDGHGFEIKGISGEVMRVFSSRRESITADLRARAARFETQYGRAPSQRELARLTQASNFATRAAKTGTLDLARAHAGWADTLAEPDPATDSQRSELTLSPEHPQDEMSQWITDLTAAHRTFAERLAHRQSMTIPAEDPTHGDLGQAFPLWPGPGRGAILQPPKPEIRPSPYVLERAADRDVDWEAGD
jgi:hypothetical protein